MRLLKHLLVNKINNNIYCSNRYIVINLHLFYIIHYTNLKLLSFIITLLYLLYIDCYNLLEVK